MIKNARYALPYAAPHVAYAHAPLVYNALDTGLVYPVAEPYVHDATGATWLLALFAKYKMKWKGMMRRKHKD